jgi:hypothetical protein
VTLDTRVEMSQRAESAPTRVARGRTEVGAKAAIPILWATVQRRLGCVVGKPRHAAFQVAEVAIPKNLFAESLALRPELSRAENRPLVSAAM